MKIQERVITFLHESPVDTGCGKVYNLASTDLIHYPLPQTASFELANQSGPGELHVHHISHEVYICIGGEGFIYWGNDYLYPIKKGDVFNIAPGTFHALNALPGKSVQVLVVSHPRFTQGDIYIIPDPVKNRLEQKPSFFMSDLPHYGILVIYPHMTVSRIQIKKEHIAPEVQLLFVISGTGLFNVEGQKIRLGKYDSIAMEKGNKLSPVGKEPLTVILVQIKEA